MLIAPEGRFIPVNMDRCQDLMGGLFEHVTPAKLPLVAISYIGEYLRPNTSRN